MWKIATATATGTSHLRGNMPCQDRLAVALTGDGWLIAAVADGAGSASLAEVGAELAVRCAMDFTVEAIAGGAEELVGVLRSAAECARSKILDEAAERAIPARELASTLLLVALGETGGAALQVGDGVIVVHEADDDWCWVFWPDHGEYANTTCFLTSDDVADHIQIETLPADIQDVALLSDGLERLALSFADTTAHNFFFEPLFRPLWSLVGEGISEQLSSALQSFLTSERVAERTDDDLSLVLATCRAAVDVP